MSDYDRVAATLCDALKLRLPPIAICFSDSVPEGIPSHTGKVPAGCVFWEHAATRVFTTTAADHALCAVGVYTHNLADPPPRYADELASVLQVMAGMEYVREEDVPKIAVRKTPAKHVIYSPLLDTPLPPEVVLLFADARQGLVITEAIQQVDPDVPPAFGRPACAVVPQVINSGHAAMSLGCCGARAYLDGMSDATALWAFPGSRIATYAERIAKLASANEVLGHFHAVRRGDVASGKTPTYAESFSRSKV